MKTFGWKWLVFGCVWAGLGACGDDGTVRLDAVGGQDVASGDGAVGADGDTPIDVLNTDDGTTGADGGPDAGPGDVLGVDTIVPDVPDTPDVTDAPDVTDTTSPWDSNDPDTAGDVTGGVAPTPVAYHTPVRTPAHPRGVTLGVTFDMPMDTGTFTVDTDGACTAAFQVSLDAFATCLPLVGPPSAHPTEANRYQLQTVSLPPSGAPLALRIAPSVAAADGTPMGWEWTAPPIAAPYHHTIVIDGVDDFNNDEMLATSTAGHTASLAWDADWLYVAMRSPDLLSNRNDTWWVVQLGADQAAGSTESVLYNTQSAALSFAAAWHLRWRASDDFGGALQWAGDRWEGVSWGPVPGSSDVAAAGDYVEMRIPMDALGHPTTVRFAAAMVREQGFNEATWAMCPAGGVDGYDPDFTRHIEASLFYRNVRVAD